MSETREWRTMREILTNGDVLRRYRAKGMHDLWGMEPPPIDDALDSALARRLLAQERRRVFGRDRAVAKLQSKLLEARKKLLLLKQKNLLTMAIRQAVEKEKFGR